MKLALAAATLILVAGGAVGCGSDDSGDGGDSASADKDTTASVDDFCGAFQAFRGDLEGVTDTEENLGAVLKKAAKRIDDVGTPKDIPDDAKEGLELTLDSINELPDDATAEDVAGIQADATDEDKANTDAFSAYLTKTCPDLGA